MISVAVAGASGYAGGELLRLLSAHPDVTIGALCAGASAGSQLGEHHPNLWSLRERQLQATTPEVLAGHDVVFLALPHGQSAELVNGLDEDVLVVDCGADFRLGSPEDWQRFYGSGYAGRWAYGMPELAWSAHDSGKHRGELTDARRIAVPGCYPTAVSLALAPLCAQGLVFPDDIVVVAASGTSGAGKALKPHLMAAEAMSSMSPYGVGGQHRHTPEMVQNLRGAAAESAGRVSLSFTPTLAPMPRGILATCTAKVRPGVTPAQLRGAFEHYYADEQFVHLLPEGQWPSTGAVLGSNNVAVQVALDESVGRAIVVAAVDNLTKGTAGAAVQCMNIAAGLDESAGLPCAGVAP